MQDINNMLTPGSDQPLAHFPVNLKLLYKILLNKTPAGMHPPGSHTPLERASLHHPTQSSGGCTLPSAPSLTLTLKYHSKLPHMALGFKHKWPERSELLVQMVPRTGLAEGLRGPGVGAAWRTATTESWPGPPWASPSSCPCDILGS